MTDCRLDVLCIGNAIVDVIANATDEFLKAEGLVKGSMRLIDSQSCGKRRIVIVSGMNSAWTRRP